VWHKQAPDLRRMCSFPLLRNRLALRAPIGAYFSSPPGTASNLNVTPTRQSGLTGRGGVVRLGGLLRKASSE